MIIPMTGRASIHPLRIGDAGEYEENVSRTGKNAAWTRPRNAPRRRRTWRAHVSTYASGGFLDRFIFRANGQMSNAIDTAKNNADTGRVTIGR